jgi:hypothetical protein
MKITPLQHRSSRRSQGTAVGPALLILALFLLVLPACQKRSEPAAGPAAASLAGSNGVAQGVLSAWEQGDPAKAVQLFVNTDWGARPLFAPGSPLAMRESDLKSLTPVELRVKGEEWNAQAGTLKQIARAVAEAGREAAAKQDSALARKHFTALKQYGLALSSPDSLAILQLVGKSVVKLADAELTRLP